MPRDLHDRVLVITGASSGIGAATARAAARAGMHVVVSGRRVDRLEAVGRQIRALGRRALVVQCDVCQDADVQRLVDATLAEFGRLDVLFANAGYGISAPVLETTDQQMRDIFETNYYGTLRAIHAAAPVMLKQGRGHIVICASAASEVGPPMKGAYAATKAAQDAIASALRAELADRRIKVTSVHPIPTVSEFTEVAARLSGGPAVAPDPPGAFRQTAEHVAECIVRALRRPRPEVWPSAGTRWGIALVTAFPRLAAWAMRKHYRHLRGGREAARK